MSGLLFGIVCCCPPVGGLGGLWRRGPTGSTRAGLCLKSQDGHLGKSEVRQAWVGLGERKSWQCRVGLAAAPSTRQVPAVASPEAACALGRARALPPLACPFLLGLPCAQKEGELWRGSPPKVPTFQGAGAQEPGQAECVLSFVHLAASGMDTSSPVSFLFSLLSFTFGHVVCSRCRN